MFVVGELGHSHVFEEFADWGRGSSVRWVDGDGSFIWKTVRTNPSERKKTADQDQEAN